ncbi:hypothetical protein KEM55_006722 [Ascosphaera atra]|nr:hypothetical protein KEM55_006722 [Ascosphaera atra]
MSNLTISTPANTTTMSATSSFSSTFSASSDEESSDDEDRQVKLALIQLLNSSHIKTDPDSRMWVQNKLMDAELRLKQRRRRRLSGCAALDRKNSLD